MSDNGQSWMTRLTDAVLDRPADFDKFASVSVFSCVRQLRKPFGRSPA
jgi:hypothetical protein